MYRIGLLCSPLHPRCLEYCKYVPQTLTDVIITSVDVCRIYLLTHAIYLHPMVHVDVISYPRNGPQTANVIWHWHYQAGNLLPHYGDVIMSAMASQITSLTVVCSNVYSGADQTKHQSSASLAFVRGIHRWRVNSPHKGPVTRKMFPFDDVIIVLG